MAKKATSTKEPAKRKSTPSPTCPGKGERRDEIPHSFKARSCQTHSQVGRQSRREAAE